MMRATRFSARSLSTVSSVVTALRCVAFLAALCAAVDARADWSMIEERWFALSLAGEPCGRSMERVEQDGLGDQARFRTTSRIEMRFVRLGQETRVDLAVAFVESAGGEPIEATVMQNGVVGATYRFENLQARASQQAEAQKEPQVQSPSDAMKVTLERGETREVREIPSRDWLTPREASNFLRRSVPTKEGVLRYRTLDLQSGLVVADIRMERGESAGERYNFQTTTSVSAVTARETYDAEGALIESKASIGLGDLVSKLATRDEANRSYDRASFDLLAGTFVPIKRIVGWGARVSLTLDIRAKGDALPDLPTVGAQRFTRVDARNGLVVIDVMRGSGAAEGDATAQRYLAPNACLDSDDPMVQAVLRAAELPTRASPNPNLSERAERLRVHVFKHLENKNLATAFASASEAARARGGDCTEHAVLLAALLRADGIPSRVVSGLVYVPDFQGKGAGFAWHLWTQALVEPPFVAGGGGRAWVDFDATLPPNERFHPGHIAVGTTDLAGGASDPVFSQALSLVGGVEIREASR
ncbi:MAG: transglutaminase domain-containing protein [Limnohabitans sp.]|nr:transglutaminase domain-containing protein [Limnohabitans sp.]